MAGAIPARNASLATFDEHGRAVAGSRLVAFGQWFGGRRVPMAGFSPVAVAPEHRGRGLGRAVTAGQYADMRDRGEVAAGLFPSSVALYRSVGFELAGGYVERRIPSAHLAPIDGGSGRRRSTRRTRRRRGGACLLRPDRSDCATVTSTAPRRCGVARCRPISPAMHLYVVDDATTSVPTIAGYAIYRHVKTRPPYDYAVQLVELMADDPARLGRAVAGGRQLGHAGAPRERHRTTR